MFLLQAMTDCGIGTCDACGKIRYLVKHHWYDNYSFPLKEYTKMICMSCNGILSRYQMELNEFPIPCVPKEAQKLNPYVVSHILPDWDKQLVFLGQIMLQGQGTLS